MLDKYHLIDSIYLYPYVIKIYLLNIFTLQVKATEAPDFEWFKKEYNCSEYAYGRLKAEN